MSTWNFEYQRTGPFIDLVPDHSDSIFLYPATQKSGGVLCCTLRALNVRPSICPSVHPSICPSALCFRALTLVPFDLFLAHLSRRLTRWAYRMGLELASVRPSVRPCVCASVLQCVRPHFQTWISPRPAGRLQPNFIWSIIGVGERLH